jgi:hypothetical protein
MNKNTKAPLKHGDDLWQLVLMYIRTYYGINPFEVKRRTDALQVIVEGKCQTIAVKGKKETEIGKALREMLVSTEELTCYSQVREIFENNTDEHYSHPFMSESASVLKESFKKYYVSGRFPSRNEGRRLVDLSEHDGLVINRVCIEEMKFTFFALRQLKHENIEEILNFQEDKRYGYFVTHVYVDVLKNVWAQKTQFSRYSVSKMFTDFLSGLEYLRKNGPIIHGCIHERNLAFNGKNWYISGLITTMKTGEDESGEYINPELKSRRYLEAQVMNKNENTVEHGDALWQLILMYVITYYWFHPFDNELPAFGLVELNILGGKCQNIAVKGKKETTFGKALREMLVSTEELKCYSKVRGIFENNTDEHC